MTISQQSALIRRQKRDAHRALRACMHLLTEVGSYEWVNGVRVASLAESLRHLDEMIESDGRAARMALSRQRRIIVADSDKIGAII